MREYRGGADSWHAPTQFDQLDLAPHNLNKQPRCNAPHVLVQKVRLGRTERGVRLGNSKRRDFRIAQVHRFDARQGGIDRLRMGPLCHQERAKLPLKDRPDRRPSLATVSFWPKT